MAQESAGAASFRPFAVGCRPLGGHRRSLGAPAILRVGHDAGRQPANPLRDRVHRANLRWQASLPLLSGHCRRPAGGKAEGDRITGSETQAARLGLRTVVFRFRSTGRFPLALRLRNNCGFAFARPAPAPAPRHRCLSHRCRQSAAPTACGQFAVPQPGARPKRCPKPVTRRPVRPSGPSSHRSPHHQNRGPARNGFRVPD